ncbi:MAG: hypothetical protein FWF57_04055 [Defluviitaleaceae bacterium]|nr:hypothetical protein [Defluviitaleaceae bacterium]
MKKFTKIITTALILSLIPVTSFISSIVFLPRNVSDNYSEAFFENVIFRNSIIFPMDFHSSNYAKLAITEASQMSFLNLDMTDEEVIEYAKFIYEALKRGEFESLEFPSITYSFGESVAYSILTQNN